ncbi:MAG: YggU family protein [Deferribacteres bacterium]|nr:YggU family protein [Deferribacteres bacterium]
MAGSDLIIKVKVEPRSSRPGIAGPYGDALKVRLSSPPVEGKANKELIEILSREFGIHKKDVEIVSGHSSRNKLVKLTGLKATLERIKKRLHLESL